MLVPSELLGFDAFTKSPVMLFIVYNCRDILEPSRNHIFYIIIARYGYEKFSSDLLLTRKLEFHRFVTIVYYNSHNNSGQYPSTCLLFKHVSDTRLCVCRQVEFILLGIINKNNQSLCLETEAISIYWVNWVGSIWTQRQDPVSETSCFERKNNV
jgi:hypothetical protein